MLSGAAADCPGRCGRYHTHTHTVHEEDGSQQLKAYREEGVQQLARYEEANGHCDVPKGYVTDEGTYTLGDWVASVRGNRKIWGLRPRSLISACTKRWVAIKA